VQLCAGAEGVGLTVNGTRRLVLVSRHTLLLVASLICVQNYAPLQLKSDISAAAAAGEQDVPSVSHQA
jgi:hypothetical protein